MGAVILPRRWTEESPEKKSLRHSLREYCAVAVRVAGRDSWSMWTNAEGKVVVFDNIIVARDHLPRFRNAAGGHLTLWSEDGETLYFLKPDRSIPTEGIVSATILTEYDVYNLPPNSPVASETRLKAWKRHIMVHDWLHQEEEAAAARRAAEQQARYGFSLG